MALRKILTDQEPILKKKCHPVTAFDQKLWDLIDDMHETLNHAHGAGLAAPQIGVLRRVVLVLNEEEELIELVNPELIAEDGVQEGMEGCLSLPGYWGEVTRPNWVKVKAQDRNGNWFEVEGSELTARCFCHELDHLDGRLYSQLCDRLYSTEELEAMEEEEA